MVTHVVLFKLFPNVSQDKIDRMIAGLNGLKNEIPQLLEMHAGVNFSDRNKGYELMLVSQFVNKEDLRIYNDHPAHRKVVAEIISPIREEVVVGDIEF
ncbi:Dabb family protein [bacterium]|nr:Dabb family protein [bacterium]